MKDKVTRLFASDVGKRLHNSIFRAIEDYKMREHIERGVLVGFSGGADSVLLLSFLAFYSDFGKRFPVVALHVNHSIRGEEADRDEAFAREFCSGLEVEFISRKIDVPSLAAKNKLGLEECARECRYSEFADIIRGRRDISTICVAHNADDNLETVILNLVRGSGTRGMAGIPPLRDDIARPLIYLTKDEIVSALRAFDIGYVFDSTNADNEYKRNFVRNEILPKLREISVSPETMCARASRNLRVDDDFISSVASDFLKRNNPIRNTRLNELHEAVFARVLSMMSRVSLSSANISEVKRLLCDDNFSYSLPEGNRFLCEYGVCRVVSDEEMLVLSFDKKLENGINVFDDFDADIIISNTKIQESFLNVYKFSIQANLSSAIIKGDLYVRSKTDGDSIKYGGITRKLKKLFNDRKIPPSYRHLIPIVCDDMGALYVPGFGVRDDGVLPKDRRDLFLYLCIGKGKRMKNLRFHSGNEVYK